MDFDRAKTIVCALVIAALAGCGGEGKDVARTGVVNDESVGGDAAAPAAASSDLRWRNDAYRELDGDDENAERLIVSVSKGSIDSTVVRLEIRTSKDRLLYRHEWPAVSYMKYGAPGSARDSMAVLRETERQIGKIFADSAFTRIQAIAAEARDMPAFRYYAGGEETYVVAWSASEGRMVRIAACC